MRHSNQHYPSESFPLLWNWYQSLLARQKQPVAASEKFLFECIKALAHPKAEGARIWFSAMDSFFRDSTNALVDFLNADELSLSRKTPITEVLAALCENAILAGEGRRALDYLKKFASQTNLSAIRFLSGWTALNIGDLEECIEECEKDVEPTGPVYTLLGQALLESGRVEDAIEALIIASKKAPSDPLALVQLIKAYLVAKQPLNAIPPIETCRLIVGLSEEIECLAAFVIIDTQDCHSDFARLTIDNLLTCFQQDKSNLDLLSLLFDVFKACNDQESAARVFSSADYRCLAQRPDFLIKFGKFLRCSAEINWFRTAEIITSKLSAVTNQNLQKYTI
ncbi:MAG: hypothetical protein NT027_20390 [Proteobacteria bacterium]|nr:hypothetical protein [Pseudomonadota bacterium]